MGRVHDVVAIGSGIGGLTAAALCAADGLDVVVLEGHTRPGGCAGDFRRRGATFPAGATVLMGFEEGGLHRWVYERLGLPVVARRMDLAMTVHLPDREVRVPTSRDAWEAERRRAFPNLNGGGERFWGRVQRLAEVAHRLAGGRPALPLSSLADVLDTARATRLFDLPATVAALPALWQTVGGQLRAAGIAEDVPHRTFVDNQLLISMQCTADECVALSGALALDVYRHGIYELPAGPATVAADLIGALRRRDGAIQYRQWATRLAREGERWCVSTASGDRWLARSVVVNLPPTSLVELLGDAAPRTLTAATAQRAQPWGAVVLYATLRPDAGISAPFATTSPTDTADSGQGTAAPTPPRYHQVVGAYGESLEDGGSCFVSNFGPESGRPGGPERLTVSTHTRVERWWRLTDRPSYLEEKARIGERLLRSVERAMPGTRGRVLFWEVATPRSFSRWIGRHEGRVGGLAQTLGNANLGALSHRTGLPGLFLCGDSVFPGQGTIGVTLSGIVAARSAVRDVTARASATRRRRR